jgi:hypothetical protein
MSASKYVLTALGAAIALYVVIFVALGVAFEPTCTTLERHWWGALVRCSITVPLR